MTFAERHFCDGGNPGGVKSRSERNCSSITEDAARAKNTNKLNQIKSLIVAQQERATLPIENN